MYMEYEQNLDDVLLIGYKRDLINKNTSINNIDEEIFDYEKKLMTINRQLNIRDKFLYEQSLEIIKEIKFEIVICIARKDKIYGEIEYTKQMIRQIKLSQFGFEESV